MGEGDTYSAMDQESLPAEQHDTAAFELPEGSSLDAQNLGAVRSVFSDLNLTQEQAGKLVSTYAEKVVPLIESRALKAADDAGAELKAEMAGELLDDPEVGGSRLQESRAYAAKAITHFIPDATEREAFNRFLNATGFGEQRYIMRILSGAGRLISGAKTPPISDIEKFYGKRPGRPT